MSADNDNQGNDTEQQPSAETVADYLEQHPEFFVDRDELVKQLTIPHDSGAAISLLQYQVNVLRESNQVQLTQIEALISNANVNDTLFEKTRIVILALLKARDLESLSTILAEEMGNQFATAENHLFFISDEPILAASLNTKAHTEAISVLGELFDKKRTYCGQLDQQQADFFFGDSEREIASVAIVPVHLQQESLPQSKPVIPVLVLGSSDADYFHSNQDTLFLDFIGEVMATLIGNFLS